MSRVRVNWNRIISHYGADRLVQFAQGQDLVHNFRNSSSEARRLVEGYGNGALVRRRCLQVARRRNLVS